MLFERLDPVIDRPQLVKVKLVDAPLPLLADRNDTGLGSTPRCFETAGCGSPSETTIAPTANPRPAKADR